jgi:mitofusin
MDPSSSRKDTPVADSNMSPDPSRSSKAPMSTHRPNYMTVGTGSPSASAAALTAILDSDSGYGSGMIGSGVFGSASSQRWEPDSATQMSDYFHEPDTQDIWSSGG